MSQAKPAFSETATSSFQRALLAHKGDSLPKTRSWADPAARVAETAALIAELGSLGVRGRSIKPEVLRNYERLIDTPQVQARVRAGAEPGEAAHEALKAAIAAIPDQVDRLIAEAVLAARPEYENLKVEDRKKVVLCGPDTYKRRRPRVMQQLAEELLQAPAAGQEGNVRQLIPAQHADVIADLGCVVLDAARLHFGLLACRLAQVADHDLAEKPLPGFPARRAWDRLLGGVYDIYYDLIISGMSCFAEGAHAKRAEVAAYLPPLVFASMEEPLNDIYTSLPISGFECRELCKYHHGTERGVGFHRCYRQELRAIWQRWAGRTFDPNCNDPASIEPIVSACATCALIGIDYVETPQPFTDGATEVLNLLGDFFGVAPYEPITDKLGSLASLTLDYIIDNRIMSGSPQEDHMMSMYGQWRQCVKQLSKG